MTVKMTRKTSGFSNAFILNYLKTAHLQQLIYSVLQELVYKITEINNIGRERGQARSKKKAFTGCQFYSSPLG